MTIKTKNIGFYLGYVFFLIGQLLGHTTIPVSNHIRYFFIWIGIICLLEQFINSFLHKAYMTNEFISKRVILFFILFLVISIISTIKSGQPIVIIDCLFILTAINVDFDKILKIFIITATTLLLFTMLCNALGLIQTIYVQRAGVVRNTFGYRFPTDFAQLIVYILLADLTLCMGHSQNILPRIIIYILLGFFTSFYSDARLGSGTIFLLIPAALILKYGKKLIKSTVLKWLEKYIFILCTIFSIFIMNKFISSSNGFLTALDEFTSYRLTNTRMGISFFGSTIFGQDIYSRINQFFRGWFYIDSSYYIFLLEYGIVLLILIEFGYIWSIKRCIKVKNYIIPFICMFVVLDSLIDQQFYLLEYNVFLLIPFANLNTIYSKNNEENSFNKSY
ncbi:hypothetical protein [Lactobacillus amylovorus]|uniref:hypothetical protein n=1 Tax=Lactobacillus amylovorus TaxID=1604 RepID=UPI001CCED363|nr:hypothetical protein [Lactobacillus amylovorus]